MGIEGEWHIRAISLTTNNNDALAEPDDEGAGIH
jgi:hypothetical protein